MLSNRALGLLGSALVALSAAGCFIDAIGEETSGSGASGTGAGDSTTTGASCTKPSDCQIPSTCSEATCEAGVCGALPLPAGTFCGDGVLQACDGAGVCLGLPARACGNAADCLSGFCVDGVCCVSACDGGCESCALSASVGTCTPHPAATDPEQSCGAGVCDGAANCANGDLVDGSALASTGVSSLWRMGAKPNGGAVLGGRFIGNMLVGNSQLDSDTGSWDVWVASLSAANQVLWAKRLGNAFEDSIHGLAVDAMGRTTVSGTFFGTVNFGGIDLVSSGYDHYVVQLDATGGHVWSKRFGDSADQQFLRVATAPNGDVLLAGGLYGTVDFGGGPLVGAGGLDAVVVRLSSAGTHLWSKRFGDAGFQWFDGVAVDGAGEVILVGRMAGSVDFGGGALVAQGDDAMVVKLDSAGNHLWSKRFGDGAVQLARNVATDANNNIFVAGDLDGTTDFGGGPLTSAGSADVFLLGLTAEGNHRFSRRFGDAAIQRPYGLEVDGFGNLAMTGDLYGTADFGTGALVSAGDADVFIAKFANDGSSLWGVRYGDAQAQYGNGAVVSSEGNVWAGGFFNGAIAQGAAPALTAVGGAQAYWLLHAP